MSKKRKKTKKNYAKKGVSKVPSKSQTWSLDVLIAVSVFIAGIIIFFYLITFSGEKGVKDELASESELIPENLISASENDAKSTTIVIGNKVDPDRLKYLLTKPYNQLKSELGVRSDFCIHFEDENGNIIDLDDDPDRTQYSIGHPKLNLTFINETGQQIVIPCGS